jgi:DNA replication initiation complex subunit (GINS family)
MADEEPRVTYEFLYELVRREKSKEELQKLDDSYLAGLLVFLREQDGRMTSTGPKSDLFAISERDQLMVQSQNTRRLVRELYERRERKVVDLALNRSRTGSDLIDTSNLIPEEKALFDMLVTSLDAFRRGILGNMLALKEPERALVGISVTAPTPVSAHRKQSVATVTSINENDIEMGIGSSQAPESSSVAANSKPGHKRIKFTQPVEQFVGQELELYGPFQPGEEAELPETVAEVLLAQNSAVQA